MVLLSSHHPEPPESVAPPEHSIPRCIYMLLYGFRRWRRQHRSFLCIHGHLNTPQMIFSGDKTYRTFVRCNLNVQCLQRRESAIIVDQFDISKQKWSAPYIIYDTKTVFLFYYCVRYYYCSAILGPRDDLYIFIPWIIRMTLTPPKFECSVVKLANLADYNSDTVRRWVESNPTPTLQNNNIDIVAPGTKPFKNNLNNNTIGFEQTFWKRHKEDNMPMLLQQPSHVLLSTHEADQPLDFTMSKFKTKTATSVASQLKQFNDLAAQQHMMLLQNNGVYFNRSNNNKSFTRGSSPSPSSSSEEEGVGPPGGSPRSPPPSPAPLRGDGKLFYYTHPHLYISRLTWHVIYSLNFWHLHVRSAFVSFGRIGNITDCR